MQNKTDEEKEQIAKNNSGVHADVQNQVELSGEYYNSDNPDKRHSLSLCDTTAVLKESTIDKHLRDSASKSSPNYD